MRIVFLLLLVGCKACDEGSAGFPDTLEPLPNDLLGAYVGEGLGVGSATVPVFAYNTLGAVVPGDDLTVSTGALDVDAFGWGTVTLDDSVPVTATANGDSGEGHSWVIASALPQFELPGFALYALDQPAQQLVVAGEGAVWASGGTIWWAMNDQPAVPVAQLPEANVQMQPVYLDSDGVTDLALWSDTAVLLLRGRSGGGLTYAAGWTADGVVTGCDVQDLDGDALADVQVAATVGDSTEIVWLLNDGDSWELADSLTVDYEVLGLSGEDYTGDGEVELSVITEDGLLRRYSRYDEDWQLASNSDLDLEVAAGARLYPSADLDGDGTRDLIVAGPMRDGSGAQVQIVTAGAEQLLSYNFYADGNQPDAVQLAFADFTQDGLLDVVMASELGLQRVAWDPAAGTFTSISAGGFPTENGVGAGDLNGDAVPDTLLAGSSYVVNVQGYYDTDLAWKIVPSDFAVYNLKIVGEPYWGDLTDDGAIDFISFYDNAGTLSVQTYRSFAAVGDAAEGFAGLGIRAISDDADPVSLHVCANGGATTLWTLTLEDTGSMLRAFPVNAGIVGAATTELSVAGDQILCGPFADDVSVMVADHALSAITSVDGSGIADVGTLPGATVASADTDGDGLREVVSIDADGQLEAFDFDGNGVEEVVQVLDGQVSITEGRPAFGGELSIYDADGDGVHDVLLHDEGTVWVYRVIGGLLTPPEVFYTTRPVQGRVAFGEVDGDGQPDIVVVGRDDDATDGADWAGTLLYGKAD